MKKKTLQIVNGIAFVSTVIVNYLAATGMINGRTMADISARYETYFTPAGYAFSIWTFIYLGLLGFVIYQGLSLFKKETNNEAANQVGWWFIITCAANCFWVISFLYDYIGLSVLIMIILLFALVQIIFRTNMEMELIPLKKVALVWWPFCLYAGWITVALVANVAVWLTKIGWGGFGVGEITWTVIMIIIAGAINILITWSRNMREFGLVGVWALIAIAVANWGEVPSVVYAAIVVAAVVFLSSVVHGYKNRKTSFLERAEGKW